MVEKGAWMGAERASRVGKGASYVVKRNLGRLEAKKDVKKEEKKAVNVWRDKLDKAPS